MPDVALFLAAGLLAGQASAAPRDRTVREFLAPPELGPGQSEEVRLKEFTQTTAGSHEGHRILLADTPLLPKAAEAPDVPHYALRYHACLDVEKHPGAVDVRAKEGLSGIGLPHPSSSNWYAGGFVDVRIDRVGLGNHKPALRRIRYGNAGGELYAQWAVPAGTVTLRFLKLRGEPFFRILGTLDCPSATAAEVQLRCYPGVTKRTGTRVAWTGTKEQRTSGGLSAGLQDCWFLLADEQFDLAKQKDGGRGPCAVLFSPSELQSARAHVSDYAVDVSLRLRPRVRSFHLALWEFPATTNAQALAAMRAVVANLTVELGLAATAPVRTEDVPPRALVVDGQPSATVLLPAEPAQREMEAALELQDYVERSTGAVLPVVTDAAACRGHVVELGTRAPGPGEENEAFRTHTSAGRTSLLGNSPLAVLYAVYDLLERAVGVRWYLPGPLGEVVPEHRTLVLPELNLQQSPSFPMRWIGRGTWALRNKQNPCDDGFLISPGIYHTQNRLLPHRKYFSEHPEFFALIKGERSAAHECKLCYSNPDLPAEIARNMGRMLEANSNIRLISLSPTDGQMWCECEGCRAMDEEDVPKDKSKSRRSLLFYNAVARELRKTHPDAKMLVGAYNVYNWPPKDATVKADPMLNVIITHYEDYCMAHPVPDADCPLNRRYVQLIREWQELGCGIYYYEYYWKVNWLDLPWPIVHSIRGDMPWYKQKGHQGVFTQFNPDCIWGQYPAHYLAARLLWDLDTDVDAVLDRMFEDLYGTAAPHMKAYNALLEERTATCGKHFPGRGLSAGPAVFTEEVRAKMHEHYGAAVAANTDPVVAQRLEKIGASVEYVDRLMEYAALKKQSMGETDPQAALDLAGKALSCGESLVAEVRADRKKWGGVVSRTVVGDPHYLGRDVNRWRQAVERKRLALVKIVAPLPKTWKFALDPEDKGREARWYEPSFDDAGWKPIDIGETWESQGYEYDGFAWYRTSITAEAEWVARPLAVHFQAVDGEAWVYWNGKLLGHHSGWDEPFSFGLDPGMVHTDAPNCLAVRVYDGSNAGGIYKAAHFVLAE